MAAEVGTFAVRAHTPLSACNTALTDQGRADAQVERAKLLALATEEELKLLTRTQELAEEVNQSFPASMQLIKAVN